MGSRHSASPGPQGNRRKRAGSLPAPAPADRSDQVVRLQIFLAFVVPLLLLGGWLGSKGFFQIP